MDKTAKHIIIRPLPDVMIIIHRLYNVIA